jgi:quercetin dioxygenase-like cupin family protein
MLSVVGLLTVFCVHRAFAQPPAGGAPLDNAPYQVEPLVTADLAEVGLAGTSAAQRVTVAPHSKTAEHTHTARTSLLIMIQGTLTENRGGVRREFKAGDVLQVSEGTTHFAENYGATPVVYVEINTTAKK